HQFDKNVDFKIFRLLIRNVDGCENADYISDVSADVRESRPIPCKRHRFYKSTVLDIRYKPAADQPLLITGFFLIAFHLQAPATRAHNNVPIDHNATIMN
ncbi:hypothetical protein P9232_08225, partial [Weizmannia sp. CD-2023]|uniref:hypothetical protein n=1 Tax=Weizmannia sp. CD-2023 TaxID=3037263 RepID=UPI002E240E8C|nr:hypothetical protein [Weizmannia sp. CD-2023]